MFQRGSLVAELLARDLSTALKIPMRQSLVRVRDTGSQGGLSKPARRLNVRAAFKAVDLTGVSHITLIDDVATTSSTLNACALAALRAGVRRVDAIVIARA